MKHSLLAMIHIAMLFFLSLFMLLLLKNCFLYYKPSGPSFSCTMLAEPKKADMQISKSINEFSPLLWEIMYQLHVLDFI